MLSISVSSVKFHWSDAINHMVFASDLFLLLFVNPLPCKSKILLVTIIQKTTDVNIDDRINSSISNIFRTCKIRSLKTLPIVNNFLYLKRMGY